tara:strand:- start:321 stop:554 length:234 start_codon:yes stop_codon:yes gene_type:complete
MRSEKQKAATEKYNALRNRKLEDMPFDERVRRKEWLNEPVDPDVSRAYSILGRPTEKKRINRKKALIAIMQMRGVEL